MTPHEQAFLSKLREINGGRMVRALNAEKTTHDRRPCMSDGQLQAKLKALHNSGMPWADIARQLPVGGHRLRRVFHALLASGEIKKRPNNMMKRRLKP